MQAMNSLLTEFSTLPLIQGPPTGWRTRARLAVRGTHSNPLIGLFKEGTHEVDDRASYPEHHPAIDEALALLRPCLTEFKIEPYNEKTSAGDLRYIQFAFNRLSNLVQITLVANGSQGDLSLEPLVKKLISIHPWHSIWINIQEGPTNTILGPKWIHCFGELYFWEEMGGNQIAFHPACFAQANPALFEEILNQIQSEILPQRDLLELYAGVGVIGLSVAKKCRSLTCIEISPLSKECFALSRAKIDHPALHFEVGPARLIPDVQVLIVDPPRKGLDAKLTEAIISSSLEQIIYVSCSPPSLARDASKLLTAGWKLKKASAYALFPGTPHIEILAVFEK